MRLFVKDHLMLIAMNLLQLFFLLSTLWLEGFTKVSSLMYIFLLGFVLLCLYLTVRYVQNRSYYHLLSQVETMSKLDDTIQLKANTYAAKRTEDLLHKQYQLYMKDVGQFESRQKQHILFMNQWVHQMKTPLSVANLMTKGRPDPLFVDIQEQLDRMEKGLDMVLYMSRLESFELDFFLEQTDILELLNEVLRDHRRLLIKNELYPSVHGEEGLIIITDKKWLAFIMSQIVTNAVRYSMASSQLDVRLFREKDSIVVEVEDYGVGIAPQDVPRVFDAHFTGENGRLYLESTGMGLYMAKEVCLRLTHTIEVTSVQGSGTTVRMTFAVPRDLSYIDVR
ncbi:sensor histidine kinase [Paenibacillus sp. IHBB 10380]|uniref:sensor histidine kinase n=1 Tax=Paenibacillus sp. IHBB 10380 TaxID=1566358 RepID=UPI0005CF9B41|nr:sensor histidine kinase [Paenibacillus sp. IHBB 10380]AJS61237.1 hypothetical protein UB51_25525 [Paenibacillus sp. IHBB 10380]